MAQLGNFSELVGLSGSNQLSRATRFSTGTNAAGYALESVVARIASVSGVPAPRVSIYDDASGLPGASVHALTSPASFGAGQMTFSAPAGAVLAANTHYWVVFENTASGSYNVLHTSSAAEDPGAAAGWSIADNRASRSSDTAAFQTLPFSVHLIGVIGAPRTASTDATLSDLTLADAPTIR